MKKFAVAYHINTGTKGMFFVCAENEDKLTRDKLSEIVKKETSKLNVPTVVINAATDYIIEEIGEDMKSPYCID